MDLQSTCPACGAPLPVSDTAGRVTCPYCKTRFVVDLNASQPMLSVVTGEEIYPQAPEPPAGELPPYVVEPGADTSAGGFEFLPYVEEAGRSIWLKGRRLWLAIGLAVLGVGCISCLCLVVLVRNLFH